MAISHLQKTLFICRVILIICRKGIIMENESSLQVGNMGAPVQTYMVSGNNTSNGNNISGSLFNFGMNGKNYSNDMIMPDFLKTGNITDEQRVSIFGPVYPQQVQTNQADTQYHQAEIPKNPEMNDSQIIEQNTRAQLEEYYKELVEKNPNLRLTEKGNIYEVSSAGKKTGILTGIGAGLANGIIKVFRGETLSKAFNLKGLALKLPILAISGWAIGSIIDTFANASSRKQADAIA